LLKDVIKEKDPAARITKAKILRDAVKVSSVLYSEGYSGEGYMNSNETTESFSSKSGNGKACPIHGSAPKAEGMPNQVNKNDANAVTGNPVKGAVLNDLVSSTAKLVNSVSEIASITGAKAAPATFADGSMNPNQNFAGGPRMEIHNGESVSSIPASVPADSDHVSVFAEDIKEGDVFNGRRVNAITEEINPIDGTVLYSFELDDRSILRASAGTPVTFSYKDERNTDMENNNTQFSESVALAISDFEKGIRTYSDDFSTIMDYHDTDPNFDAEEYAAAFSALENDEATDPVNQMNAKIDAIYGALFGESNDADFATRPDMGPNDRRRNYPNWIKKALGYEGYSDNTDYAAGDDPQALYNRAPTSDNPPQTSNNPYRVNHKRFNPTRGYPYSPIQTINNNTSYSEDEISLANQFSEVLAKCNDVEFDDESGLIFASYEGIPLVFSDEDGMVYTYDDSSNFNENDEPEITPVVSYSELLFGSED